jgi:hypothetical protein
LNEIFIKSNSIWEKIDYRLQLKQLKAFLNPGT